MTKHTTNADEESAKLNALEQVESEESHISSIGDWIDIKRETISYEGKLYHPTLRFQVKPVVAKTIKYFSSLDETNALSVNDALSYVIKHHVRILNDNKIVDTLKTIYEHDRFFFVLLVHLYSGAPTKLAFPSKCSHSDCNHKQDVEITSMGLQYTELSEKAYSYLNESSGQFVVQTKSMGIKTYKPLTLHQSAELTEFTLNARNEGTEIEQLFIKVAGFFLIDRKINETLDNVYQKYLRITSSPKEIALLIKLNDIINPSQLLEVEVKCAKCTNPFRTKISTVKGIRDIFVIHSIDDELS